MTCDRRRGIIMERQDSAMLLLSLPSATQKQTRQNATSKPRTPRKKTKGQCKKTGPKDTNTASRPEHFTRPLQKHRLTPTSTPLHPSAYPSLLPAQRLPSQAATRWQNIYYSATLVDEDRRLTPSFAASPCRCAYYAPLSQT